MFALFFVIFGFVSTNSISDRVYFSGYRSSFKAIPLHLPNTNIILSSPHAGSGMPKDIPDRTDGGCRRNNSTVCTFNFYDSCSDGNRCSVTTVQDFSTLDLFTELIVKELRRTYKLLPFAIIAKWNRKKVDFNREINEATFHHPETIKSYRRYHNYLKKAIDKIEQIFNGTGLLLDVHQHAQGNYTMVGIRLSGVQLNNDDLSPTSIESLIQSSCPQDRNECIRGSKSLGTFLEFSGLGIAYPSLNNPKPNNKTFYKGGFITNNYSSRINVIQTELSYVVRNEFDPQIYVKKYVQALINFMKVNQLLN